MNRLYLFSTFCVVLMTITQAKECQPKSLWSNNEHWETFLMDQSPNQGDAFYLYDYGGGGERLGRVDSKGVLTYDLILNQTYDYPSPVQPDGFLYFAEVAGRNIQLIDAETGKFGKTIPINDPNVKIAYVTTTCGGVIYGVAYIRGEQFAVGVDPNSGALLWTSKQHYMDFPYLLSLPILTPDCSSVFYVADPYVNDADLTLNREDPVSGIVWSVPLNITRAQGLSSGGWALSVSMDFKRIALFWTSGIFDRPIHYHFFLIDTNSGTIRYQQIGSGYEYFYSYSNPIFSDDGTTLYFAPSDIFAISLNNGPSDSLKWMLSTNTSDPWSYPNAGTLSKGGKILYYTLRFVVVAVDTASSQVLWMSPTVFDPDGNYSVELEYVVGGLGHVVGLGFKDLWDYTSCEQGF